MSEFIFGYKSPSHKINIQIPVPDSIIEDTESRIVSNVKEALIGTKEKPEEIPEKSGIFGKKKQKKKKEEKKESDSSVTVATGVLILSSMILAALKD